MEQPNYQLFNQIVTIIGLQHALVPNVTSHKPTRNCTEELAAFHHKHKQIKLISG